MIPLVDNPVGPVYDVVFVVEMTANLASYINALKTSYILPTLEHFNGAPADPTDYGNDFSSTLYDLVTFHSGDIAPSPASNCTYPTTSIHKFISWLDDAEFIGGEAQRFSHISEGLGTALQVFDHIKQCRNPGITTQRHCILVCNSPPYHLPCQESHDYSGYTSDQLATMLGKRGIHLSIISPKKIPALQKLFEEAYPQEKPFAQKDYTIDPRHLVLLHGFQLQERSHTPTVEDDKQTNELIKPGLGGTAAGGVTRTHSPAPPGSCDGQFKVPGPATSAVPAQSNLAAMPQHPSPQGLSPLNPQSQASNPSVAPTQLSPGPMQPPIQQVRPVMSLPSGAAMQTPNIVTSISGGMTANTGPPLRQVLPLQGMVKQEPVNAGQQRPIMLPNQRMTNPVSIMSQSAISQGVSAPNIIMPSQPNMISVPSDPLTSQQQTVISAQQNILNPNIQIRVSQPGMQTSQPVMVQADNQSSRVTQLTMPIQPTQPGIGPGQQFIQNPATQPQVGIPGPGAPTVANPVVSGTGDAGADLAQKAMPAQTKKIIWRGMLEYQDKTKSQGLNPLPQKNTKTLSCCVSVNTTTQDFNAHNWPEKLIMQLMPQDMLNELSPLFRNSKTVNFHFQQTDMEALRNLYRIMGTGFAGCVHFPQPSHCEVRVLLLLFSNKKKAFLGLIPNDQGAFVQGIKHILTKHRTIRGIPQVSQPVQTPAQSIPTQGNVPLPTNSMTSASNIGMMTSQVPCTMPMTSNAVQQPVVSMATVGQEQPQSSVPGIMVNQPANLIGNPQHSQNERFDLQRKIQNLEQTLQMAKQKELRFQQVEQLQARNAIAARQQQQQQQQQMMEEVYFPGPPPPSHMFAAAQQQRQQLQLQQQRLQMQQGVQQQQQQQQQLQQLLQVQSGTPGQQAAQQQLHQQIMVQPQQQSQHTIQSSQPGMMANTIRQGMPIQQQGQNFIDDFSFSDLM